MSKNTKYFKLSEILDLDKIRVVGNPIETAHGLPNECYISKDYLSFEREAIFMDKWSVIGTRGCGSRCAVMCVGEREVCACC